MIGRGRVVETVVPEGPLVLVFEPIYQASTSTAALDESLGDCPQFNSDGFDSGGRYIDSSMGKSPESETKDEDDGPEEVGS